MQCCLINFYPLHKLERLLRPKMGAEYLHQVGRIVAMTYAAQAVRDMMVRNVTLNDLLQPWVEKE